MKKQDAALIILATTSLLLLVRQEIMNRYFEKHVQLQVSFNKTTTEAVSSLVETVNHNADVNNRSRGIVTKDSSVVDIYNAINRDLN